MGHAWARKDYWKVIIVIVSLVAFVNFTSYVSPSISLSKNNAKLSVPGTGGASLNLRSEIPSLPWNATWWESMSHRLCPAYVPNQTVTSTLFQLARNELEKLKSKEYPDLTIPFRSKKSKSNSKNTTLISSSCQEVLSGNFYKWYPLWNGLSRPSDGTEQGRMSVFQQWKCANRQVEGFWLTVMEDMPAGATQTWIDRVKRTWPKFDHRWETGAAATKQSTKNEYRRNRKSKEPKSKPPPPKLPPRECIVMVLRDPVSHFLSGYNEVEFRNHLFKSMRSRLFKKWPFGNLPMGSKERFQQFVVDILSCPVEQGYPGIIEDYPNQLEIQHINSMSSVLNRMAYERETFHIDQKLHYLPSLENLSTQLGPFMADSCPDYFSKKIQKKLRTTPMNTQYGKHVSSEDPTGSYAASKHVFEENGPFTRALCALHLMDYACWKDLPDGVPPVCMELYHSYNDKQLI